MYEAAGIVGDRPPLPVRRVAAAAGYIVTSDARRARESAALIAEGRHVHVDPLLREAALPESLPIPFALRPGAWVVLARIAWRLNWCESTEDAAAARARAAQAAARLEELARVHGTVLAVGHGFFNTLIARELRRAGWDGLPRPPRQYWSMAA